MTTFKPVPRDLYRNAEREAGEVLPALTGRLKRYRPVEEFEPNWAHVLSGTASVVAVVAALHCGHLDVPERAWPEVLRLYCPTAWRLLSQAEVSFEKWNLGQCDAVLCATVAAVANTELGGYAVFAVMDVPAAVAQVVATLGTFPTFT
ncbi:hypothetical protein ACIA5G_51395 [Amycolatopsis sp. NPDC051758]|uniref:hypothetical protein n=1 Tax=Amycolatopsis sp. NPDC051758 TaxID=3363935 RepID=UPI0037AC51DD